MAASSAPHALVHAARAAGMAPSVHNTQPWRWRVHPDHLELHADRSRQLRVADPRARLLTLSCGAALHHARVALAADGWQAHVQRLPEPTRPDLLARVSLGEHLGRTPEAVRLFHTAERRHTDRRPITPIPPPPAALATIRTAAETEQLHLHLLPPDQWEELAVAATRARDLAADDPAMQAELRMWVGGTRPAGTGIPDAVIPADQTPMVIPERDFGQPGTLPTGSGSDRAATYGVLFGDEDTAWWWLRSGEALSAAWLSALEQGVSLLPFSAPLELPATRAVLLRLLAGLGHPYLVIRLGLADPDHPGPAPTPRLSPTQVMEIVDPRHAHGTGR